MDLTRIRQVLEVGETAPLSPKDPRLVGLAQLSQDMGRPAPDKDAPVREVVSRLGDNWSPLILKVLSTGDFRHATLRRVVGMLSAEGEISQRMLTLRLKALERDGFIRRSVDDSIPPRVTYSLTPLGTGLTAELDRLLKWIEDNADQVQAARRRFTP